LEGAIEQVSFLDARRATTSQDGWRSIFTALKHRTVPLLFRRDAGSVKRPRLLTRL